MDRFVDNIESEGDSRLRELLATSAIGRLALSLFPRDPFGRYFMALVAYYDESGTHDGSPVTVLAGYAGRPSEWVKFETEWKKVLRKWKIPFLHAKHVFHGQKYYKGWSEQDLAHLWNDLIYVIQEREIFATKTYLYEDDYRLFYKSDGALRRERLDSRYALCFRSLLHSLPSSYLVQKHEPSFQFVLEAGHRNAGDAIRVFNELKSDGDFPHRTAIGESVSFGTKPEWCALQAADMLAYSCFAATNYTEGEGEERDLYLSDLEREIVECRLPIVQHLITPDDLMVMRKNFLRRKKLPVFRKIKLDDYSNQLDLSDPTTFFHLERRWQG